MDKGRWIYSEFAAKFLLWFLLESGVGIVILFVVWHKSGTIPCVLVSAAVGTWVVWRVVHWVNRRDDLPVIERVMELEDKFDLVVPDEDYVKIRTVADANRYFEERKHHP